MPIFLAYQSADVWSQPGLFELDAQGRPFVVAGVPPDGFSATGQIRGSERDGHRTPILAMTAGALDADRQRCVEVGMDDLLVKPVRQLDLDDALQRWIG